MLDAAGPPMKAILLLGINCGFGNSDCGNLPVTALDLERGWISYPRPKTGIDRRCPLWPETVTTIKEALARRPEPKDPADAALVFVTKYGKPWAKDIADSPVTKETRKLLDTLGINGHRNFYTLRHTFRTIADEAKDQPAADSIMGHESPPHEQRLPRAHQRRAAADGDRLRPCLARHHDPRGSVRCGRVESRASGTPACGWMPTGLGPVKFTRGPAPRGAA
jgi:integrase